MELFYYSESLIYLIACPSDPELHVCRKVLFSKWGFNCISEIVVEVTNLVSTSILEPDTDWLSWEADVKLLHLINCAVHLDAKYLHCSSKRNDGMKLNRNILRCKIRHMLFISRWKQTLIFLPLRKKLTFLRILIVSVMCALLPLQTLLSPKLSCRFICFIKNYFFLWKSHWNYTCSDFIKPMFSCCCECVCVHVGAVVMFTLRYSFFMQKCLKFSCHFNSQSNS